ncbi:heparin lyase I family protein [Wenjunlia tyrosinilytica]|uniref:Tat pathway signal sequence domain protein n=1 Tax=Wenjunlia tyrosinilytica TaxID=1544741 RepID=A0A917ZK68_9ACTN|nr:Tat pathway signal sequence domain protein [Wenjunlia tyrosinilytica]GGO84747.1 hypothetical protein GCM10012280_16930 [Wenjunlia tyrosinilytica]
MAHPQLRGGTAKRRAVILAGSAVAVSAIAVAGTHAMASVNAPAAAPTWKPMWQPGPAKDGLGAFEGVEDDRAGSHAGVKHIYVKGGAYRFDMHLRDRDSSTDRQRNEVKGMHAGGKNLEILQGQTWRFTYSMFIPDTLRATKSFTHIMQFKEPGNGTAPIMTLSLRLSGGKPTIELNSESSGKIVARTDLAPLWNHWITNQLDVTFKDGTAGKVHWTVKKGASKAIDVTKGGLDTWLGPDRARPKWGIYRSLNDKDGLRDTYLLLKDFKAFKRT